MDLKSEIKRLASTYHQDVVGIRRHLHANPELSFREFETSKYVASQLDQIGVPYQKGIVDTGLVATIKGKNPDSGTIALRADLDALPIQEVNEVDYKSKNPGVMHACGHDVHTSSMLGATRILNDLKEHFEGTIRVLFQPGEEMIPGGASLMIKEGVLENPTPRSIVGQHVYPELEAGKVGFCSGRYMASADEIYITVKGTGGHGALPHKLIDPVLISAHLITGLQQVISRHCPPFVPCVLSFGKIIGNGATNVIPAEVKIEGTFRTYDEVWREQAHRKIEEMAVGLVESMGGTCEIEVLKGFPFLTNDPHTTGIAKRAAQEMLGEENVVDLEMRMTSEDFAYYSQQIPACFYRLGVRNDAMGITSNLHTPTFNVDESALETGIGLMSWIALRQLEDALR